MATQYPESLDVFVNPTATDKLSEVPHDQQHADVNDAIEALQAKLGIDGDTNELSVDYRLAYHDHDLSYVLLDQTDSQAVTGSPIFSSLTASQAVLTDENRKLVSADYLNQAVKTTSSPTFSSLYVSTNIYLGSGGDRTVTCSSGDGDGGALYVSSGNAYYPSSEYNGGDLDLGGGNGGEIGGIGGQVYVHGGYPQGKVYLGKSKSGVASSVVLNGVTSKLVKTSSTGVLEGATAGTDYAGLSNSNNFTATQVISANLNFGKGAVRTIAKQVSDFGVANEALIIQGGDSLMATPGDVHIVAGRDVLGASVASVYVGATSGLYSNVYIHNVAGTLTGILKGTSGLVGIATPDTDYPSIQQSQLFSLMMGD